MRILMITYDKCDDSELFYPLYRMYEEGWTVDIASFEKRTIHAKYHFTAEATHTLGEINPDMYDGLMLPGGAAPEKLRQSPEVINIVHRFNDSGKPIAAICHGQQILFSAGILKGRRCTCYPGIADDLINAGGIYENNPAVTDGNIVTSRRPEDLPDFMRVFISLIKPN